MSPMLQPSIGLPSSVPPLTHTHLDRGDAAERCPQGRRRRLEGGARLVPVSLGVEGHDVIADTLFMKCGAVWEREWWRDGYGRSTEWVLYCC